MGMIAVYCGYTYDQICNMPYTFYQDIISEIVIKLQYQSITSLMGRDYADEGMFKYVSDAHPAFIDQYEKNKKKKKDTDKKVTMKQFKDLGLTIVKGDGSQILK